MLLATRRTGSGIPEQAMNHKAAGKRSTANAADMTHKEAGIWFAKSLPWLRKWLACSKASRASHFQVFRRSRRFFLDCHAARNMTRKQIIAELTKDLDEEYTPMTCYTLVFGRKHTAIYGEYTVHHIAGFLEQTGRLPTKRDKVIIWQLEPERLGKSGDKAQVHEDFESIDVKREQRIVRLEIVKKPCTRHREPA
jgi:hypothetical protein